MTIPLSERPGRHERHYRRRLDNPLFGPRATLRGDVELLEMQRLDHEELLAFLAELRRTVQRAMELAPNEGSEVVLGLKEDLDRLYEQSAGLAEDQRDNQAAIGELIEVIMRNIERGAAGDPQAVDELAQERIARRTHFELLRHPLVADLLHPESTIRPDDLTPSLLSSEPQALAAALELFDRDQLSELYASAQQRLVDCPEAPSSAKLRLTEMGARLAVLTDAGVTN